MTDYFLNVPYCTMVKVSAVSNGEKLGRDAGLVARDEVKEVNNCFMFKYFYCECYKRWSYCYPAWK